LTAKTSLNECLHTHKAGTVVEFVFDFLKQFFVFFVSHLVLTHILMKISTVVF